MQLSVAQARFVRRASSCTHESDSRVIRKERKESERGRLSQTPRCSATPIKCLHRRFMDKHDRRIPSSAPQPPQLDHGDIMVMDALAQSEYEHCTASGLQAWPSGFHSWSIVC